MKFVSVLALFSLLADDVLAFAPIATNPRSSSVLLRAATPDEKKEGLSMPEVDLSGVSEAASRVAKKITSYDFGTVSENIKEGAFGSRGEVYAAAQAALVVCIVLGGVPVIGESLRSFLGPGLLLVGAVVALLSVVDLGADSLSPFPKPTEKGFLKTEGVYAQIRHPMYTGLLSIMLGLSVLTNSADRLLLTALLLYLVEVKCVKEEEYLVEQFGEDYSDYMVRTLRKEASKQTTTSIL
jgi:protein-S-isoprenylcysteine O-methyltransferase Ste14